ncbi:MAG: hypothetical protein KDB33_01450, partial [Acidimicrobiales bacterium]|nr:hypothetical protein [Acidimicrobiales bacterium]
LGSAAVTRPLPLRADQPPDDATVVLRAGVMAAATIRRSAERTFDAYAVYGISVEGVIDETVLDACRHSERIANYRQIRLSTFGRVRNAGFALLATFEHPHFTIVLPDLSELTVARLGNCFDDPIPNPAASPPG